MKPLGIKPSFQSLGFLLVQLLACRFKVLLYGYTVHVCEQALEDKCGSALLFRRGGQEFSLLCYLVQSGEILQTTSASLSELLEKSDVQMPKNTTKNQKDQTIADAGGSRSGMRRTKDSEASCEAGRARGKEKEEREKGRRAPAG